MIDDDVFDVRRVPTLERVRYVSCRVLVLCVTFLSEAAGEIVSGKSLVSVHTH